MSFLAYEFIPKPWTPEALKDNVDKAVELKMAGKSTNYIESTGLAFRIPDLKVKVKSCIKSAREKNKLVSEKEALRKIVKDELDKRKTYEPDILRPLPSVDYFKNQLKDHPNNARLLFDLGLAFLIV